MRILNSNEIILSSDSELKKTILNLRSRIKEIETSKDKKENDELLMELQTYYCYIYRELEHRRVF